MTEAELKASVVKMAHDLGWLVFSMPQASRHPRSVKSASGYPDLTLARFGRIMWMELKTEDGDLSDKQREWFRHLPWDDSERPLFHMITPGALKDGTVRELLA